MRIPHKMHPNIFLLPLLHEHILVVLELFMTFSEHNHYSAQLAFVDKYNKYNTFRGIETSHILK